MPSARPAARSPSWSGMTAYNRGQVVYRIAEMLEARRAEFADLSSGADEVDRSIDRLVWYAGWADKLAQVLGSSNPVAGPYFNFTVPEPTGVVGILAPDEPPLARARLPRRTRDRRRQHDGRRRDPRPIRSPRSSWRRCSRPQTFPVESSTC